MKSLPNHAVLFGSVGVLLIAIAAVAGFILVRDLASSEVDTTRFIVNDDGVTRIDPTVDTGDWTLTDTQEQAFSADQLRGKPTLLFFGFANCPDICPLTLREFQRVQRALGEQSNMLNVVFISVDGNRDTPALLRTKLAQIGVQDSVIGLTGSPDDVLQMGQPFGLTVVYGQPDDTGFYSVDHTASYFLLDAQGRLTTRFAFGTDRALIIEEVQKLLD